jgi:hypothetical protein
MVPNWNMLMFPARFAGKVQKQFAREVLIAGFRLCEGFEGDIRWQEMRT